MNSEQIAETGRLAELLATMVVDSAQIANETVGLNALAFPHGVHRNVPDDVYHRRKLGLVSKHALDYIIPPSTPAHYFAWASGRGLEKTTPALDFGRAAHCALLEPSVFERRYVVMPDFGPQRADADKGVTTEQGRENKKRKREWLDAHAEATHFLAFEDMRTIRGISESLGRHPLASKLLEHGVPELTLRWRDPETGLECKGRVDYDAADIFLFADLKTCEDASPEAFARDARKYGYRRQDALYSKGTRVLERPRDFLFICVEKADPWPVAIYRIDEAAAAMGAEQNARAMDRMAVCLEENNWPAYSDEIVTVGLERWEERNNG